MDRLLANGSSNALAFKCVNYEQRVFGEPVYQRQLWGPNGLGALLVFKGHPSSPFLMFILRLC